MKLPGTVTAAMYIPCQQHRRKDGWLFYFCPDASVDAALPPLPLLTHCHYNQPAATASKEHKLAMQDDGMGVVLEKLH